ncbi:hypothetical protein, partial [Collinsella ihumii]|uniref:hypothetical protein n=1 Tax=Collinsella ihumii TaxID=1720204 RepID=UPI001C9CAB82
MMPARAARGHGLPCRSEHLFIMKKGAAARRRLRRSYRSSSPSSVLMGPSRIGPRSDAGSTSGALSACDAGTTGVGSSGTCCTAAETGDDQLLKLLKEHGMGELQALVILDCINGASIKETCARRS